jgi:8-oxo-dGTP pyrophosphatase MutT (NUDIX family)
MTDALRRTAARVLVVDRDGRILLLRGADPARPQYAIWHPPGGGVEVDESLADAAIRETREEIGLVCDDVGPPVWWRRVQFSFDGRSYDQEEWFFHVPVDGHDVDTSGWEPNELRYLSGFRWWTPDQLRACRSPDLIAPPDLADRLDELLRDGPPAQPVEVGGAVLP